MSLLDWFYGTSDLQAQSDALDAQNDQLTQQRVDAGIYDQAYLDARNKNLTTNTADRQSGYHQNVSAQVSDAFDQGWQEGANNVSGFVSKIFNGALKPVLAVLKGIPWWVWLAAAAALFLWLGGGSWLARKARGKFS